MKKNKKIILLICLVIILIILVGVCFIYKDKFTSNNKSNNDKSTTKENIDTTNTDTVINIETTSGVIIVGTIEKDDDGWYIKPENKLNITLNYYIDMPEYFENVDKLRLLQETLDTLGHTLTINEEVTITGELTNPRSAGILYLNPYEIQKGKTVEVSQTKEDIELPKEEVKEFDYSQLPSKMESTIVDNKYEYNFYMLSNETLEYVGNDFLDFYLDFVDAYLNYKTSVACPSKDYADKLMIILTYEFPIFDADTEYDALAFYDTNTKTISWKYTTTKSEHNKIINNFKENANNFLSGVKQNQNDSLKAQIIYHNIASTVKYDYDGLETGINLEPYYVYTNKTGVCYSFSFTYSQLLTQVGIENSIAVATPKDSIIGHSWNVIKIDNKYYFSDITYELTYENGSYYTYFGIDMTKRLNNGEYDEYSIYVGKYNTKLVSEIGEFNNTLKIQSIN